MTKIQKSAIEKGPTSARVAANIRHFREARGLKPPELSEVAAGLGRHINHSSLWKMENGDRRVDVDDLVTLALALAVTPNLLLLRDEKLESGDPDARIELTPARRVGPLDAWRWASGATPLPEDDTPPEQFRRENRPPVGDRVSFEWIGKNMDLLTEAREFFSRAEQRGVSWRQLGAFYEMADIDAPEAERGGR